MNRCTCRLASAYAVLDLSSAQPLPRLTWAVTLAATRHFHATSPSRRISGEALLRAQTGFATPKDRYKDREISDEDRKAYMWGEDADAERRSDRAPGPWDEQLQELRRLHKKSSPAGNPASAFREEDGRRSAPIPDGAGGLQWRTNVRHVPPVNQQTKEENKHKPAWEVQKEALKRKFPEGWRPLKKLSPDARNGIRTLHKQFPDVYTTPVLANKFEVSPEVIRRILKSDFDATPDEEVQIQERWLKRGDSVWKRYAALGLKPPRKWRGASGAEVYGAKLLSDYDYEPGGEGERESQPRDLQDRVASNLI